MRKNYADASVALNHSMCMCMYVRHCVVYVMFSNYQFFLYFMHAYKLVLEVSEHVSKAVLCVLLYPSNAHKL